MTTPTITETRRNGNHIGARIERGRYRTNAGVERILYGRRVGTVVRFLPEEPVVLDSALGSSENSECCPREPLQEDGSRAPHDRNEQTTMADKRRQPTPQRPGAVAPAPAWSWRGTR